MTEKRKDSWYTVITFVFVCILAVKGVDSYFEASRIKVLLSKVHELEQTQLRHEDEILANQRIIKEDQKKFKKAFQVLHAINPEAEPEEP